jgi:hypothetical protein
MVSWRRIERIAKRGISALCRFFVAVFLRFTHGAPMEPVEINPPKEVFDALYPAVGSVVIYWSLVEQSLEHWVAIIYHHPGGNKDKKQIPFLLGAKLTFLRARFSDAPDLAGMSSEGLALLNKIEQMAKTRDILVHGAISAYQPKTQRLKFIRLGINKADRIHTLNPDYLSIPKILEAADVILGLMTTTINFSNRLVEHLVGKDGDYKPPGSM